jgi:hypothetical protein
MFCNGSMKVRADQNNIWAVYAGPGGWNGMSEQALCLSINRVCVLCKVKIVIYIYYNRS